MLTVEEFVNARRDPSYLESKMARAYWSALEELELAKDCGNLLGIEEAQCGLTEIKSDIEHYMNDVVNYSWTELRDKLDRRRLDIENAKRKARNTLKRARRDNPELSPDNVEKLDEVQAAIANRDRIVAELKPVRVELSRRFKEVHSILRKYK